MIFKNILSLAASTIKLFIFLTFLTNSIADENTFKEYANDAGTLSIMYHRFEEKKYPSTNIQMNIFEDQIEIIKLNGFKFYDPKDFINEIDLIKKNKKILITIDDAFRSFYKHAWPYLKKNKIPFILFVSTEPVGKKGYMNWEEIKEVEKEKFAYIGNHSHSHDYLVNYDFENFKKDIDKSIEIFKNNLGYNPEYFSYPFGEYSLDQKNFIKGKFKNAFGQHSGVIDVNKDKYELPRFPINEKYGDLERFEFLIKLNPLEYNNITLKDKLVSSKNNPPKLSIIFFEKQKNLDRINCFSNEGEDWNKTSTNLIDNKLIINFNDKFKFRRGRINCSMKDEIGWRWLGLQFTIK